MKKLTKEHLESLIEKTEYKQFGDTVIVCGLTLKNGFTVIGSAGCREKDMFDAERGERIAYDSAFRQLWELEEYKKTKVTDGRSR